MKVFRFSVFTQCHMTYIDQWNKQTHNIQSQSHSVTQWENCTKLEAQQLKGKCRHLEKYDFLLKVK